MEHISWVNFVVPIAAIVVGLIVAWAARRYGQKHARERQQNLTRLSARGPELDEFDNSDQCTHS